MAAGLLRGLDDETADTALTFRARARTFFTGHGITVERALTDDGGACTSHARRTEHQHLRPAATTTTTTGPALP